MVIGPLETDRLEVLKTGDLSPPRSIVLLKLFFRSERSGGVIESFFLIDARDLLFFILLVTV